MGTGYFCRGTDRDLIRGRLIGDIPVAALGGTPIVIGARSLPPAPPAPTPEMPAVVLLSIGLSALGGYVLIRRKKVIRENIGQ